MSVKTAAKLSQSSTGVLSPVLSKNLTGADYGSVPASPLTPCVVLPPLGESRSRDAHGRAPLADSPYASTFSLPFIYRPIWF
jgi:hypothetical protein